MVTLDNLVDAISAATCEKDVVVPRTGFYAREGDTETERIRYVDPERLIERLQELASEAGDAN